MERMKSMRIRKLILAMLVVMLGTATVYPIEAKADVADNYWDDANDEYFEEEEDEEDTRIPVIYEGDDIKDYVEEEVEVSIYWYVDLPHPCEALNLTTGIYTYGTLDTTLKKSFMFSEYDMESLGQYVFTPACYTFKGWRAATIRDKRLIYSDVLDPSTKIGYVLENWGSSSGISMYPVFEYVEPHPFVITLQGDYVCTRQLHTYTGADQELRSAECEGRKFAGWYTEKTGGRKCTSVKDLGNDWKTDVTLYAHWE